MAAYLILKEGEMELAILALQKYQREHLDEYDEEDRKQVAAELRVLIEKLRAA